MIEAIAGATIALNLLGIWRNHRLHKEMLADAETIRQMLVRVTSMQDEMMIRLGKVRGVYLQPDPEMRQ
jgi:hypothetical protein